MLKECVPLDARQVVKYVGVKFPYAFCNCHPILFTFIQRTLNMESLALFHRFLHSLSSTQGVGKHFLGNLWNLFKIVGKFEAAFFLPAPGHRVENSCRCQKVCIREREVLFDRDFFGILWASTKGPPLITSMLPQTI